MDNLPEHEQNVQCPFNKYHNFPRNRLQKHLFKCKKSYNGPEMKQCNFNACHYILVPEFKNHVANCPDRLHVEKLMEGIGPAKRKAEEEGASSGRKCPSRAAGNDDDEEWDGDGDKRECLSLEERKRRCLESDKVVHHQHGSKSQLKNDRIERHSKIAQRSQQNKQLGDETRRRESDSN